MAITLVTGENRRLWLTSSGFERVLAFVRNACEITYPVIARIPLNSLQPAFVYHDLHSPVCFDEYDATTHPPPGFHSDFVCPHDFIPGPWGNAASPSSRMLTIASGTIIRKTRPRSDNFDDDMVGLPDKNSELHASKFECNWKISVHQDYVDAQPTRTFHFYLDDANASGSPIGLYERLQTRLMSKSDVAALPMVRSIASERHVAIRSSLQYQQVWDQNSLRWRGVVKASIKKGLFSWEEKEFFAE